jgi:uncharacterized membrane protein YraQ (UPF0718 family)
MDIFYPIEWFTDRLVYDWLQLPISNHWAGALNFFVYDSIKIFLLLVIINYLMAVVRTYLPTEKIRDFLTKRKWYGLDYLLASSFGVITPFCSCSSIPLFIGFLSAGIPLGVTMAFLITSPLVNEASILIFAGIFGWKFTELYEVAGLMIGAIGGWVLGKLRLEKYIDDDMKKMIEGVKNNTAKQKQLKIMVGKMWGVWWEEGWKITKQIMPYVLAGVALGALIHGLVPANFFEIYLKDGGWWSIPLATIMAVPLYSNAVGVIPVMEVLVNKGVPLGRRWLL